MPIEIRVTPPGITISQGRTFMVTDEGGEISPKSDQGVYALDTRFISYYRLFINRTPWALVNSSQVSFYASRIHLANPTIDTEVGVLEANSINLTVNRMVGEGVHEEFEIVSYVTHPITFVLELSMRSDFADIFEVKSHHIIQRGMQETHWDENDSTLHTTYNNKDFHRGAIYQVSHCSSPARYANGRISFIVNLEHNGIWHTCGDLMLEHGEDVKRSIFPCSYAQNETATKEAILTPTVAKQAASPASSTAATASSTTSSAAQPPSQSTSSGAQTPSDQTAASEAQAQSNAHATLANKIAPPSSLNSGNVSQIELLTDFAQRQLRWRENCTELLSPSYYNLERMYQQAIDDMGALRIYDLDVSETAWVPAAGVPWFVTLFGRDSLIVSYQNMTVSPGFARGALYRLAQFQGTERVDWRDEQPGKIMHEIRFGELAFFHKIPFTPYYGTADATILYLIVLSEAYRWTNEVELLKEYCTVAEKCLDWIDHWGDLDGDGFQEYKTFSTLGYNNLAWKDGEFSVVYGDGRQVKQPKATCELQGYVYDAKLRMAEVFQVLGDETRAKALQQQAETLKQRFNEAFWLEKEGCYAFGLDPDKKLIDSVSSNAGQCLWNGIAEPDKAVRTARRLLQDDMWNGWGIRTLSDKNPAYNPYAYQLGAVWPHDNGIIAAGFKRYG
ncbi:MAG TPA: glycogen debranching N-terminal domain-containing protein, partial [Ktedonobacteraceae bacterium]|nr:glycogen debranching N-terminal domain-containing protein [Ktedonobacteraceae bacterium]